MKFFTKKGIAWLALAVAIFSIIQGLIIIDVLDYYYQITLITIGINIILAIGLNLIIGLAGQFSLGHAGFMSIGAYTCAIMTIKMPTPLGFILGIILGLIVAGATALLVALPTLRLKGDYLAIATLGTSEIIRITIVNSGELTNGAAGLSNLPIMTTWPIVFGAILVTILIVVNYIKSSPGRATVAIKEDEIAAESMGIDTTKYKTIAFVIGALTASVAGALHASLYSVIKPETFGFMKSVDILIIVVFGGLGSITGSIIAAIFLGLINIVLQSYGALRMIIYAVALIAIMVFRPGGLLGNKEFTMTGLFQLFKKKQPKEEQ